MSALDPWTRDNVLELHIFILLLIWFIADRCNFYFTDIPHYWYMIKLYWGAWRAKAPTDYPGPR
jgi:hypothetical protein